MGKSASCALEVGLERSLPDQPPRPTRCVGVFHHHVLSQQRHEARRPLIDPLAERLFEHGRENGKVRRIVGQRLPTGEAETGGGRTRLITRSGFSWLVSSCKA
jgi:hypothetical protein